MLEQEVLRSSLQVFLDKAVDKETLRKHEENMMMALYNVQHLNVENLDMARFYRLKQMIARQCLSSPTTLATLPPTSGSCYMYTLRVYHQVQQWYGNNLNPLEYGWEFRAGNLLHIGSDREAAPVIVEDVSPLCECVFHMS